jgi:uncharacterized cupin superfamily protein
MNWENIINLENLNYEAEESGDHYKGGSAPLASKMGAKKLGFHAEILYPKKFSCPYHFHHSEEELFLVLEGSAILRQADRFREVSRGDLIHFSNSPDGAHQFYNHTEKPFRFLALSTMDNFEVVEYPDSKKISVVKLKKTFQAESAVAYFTGEEDPRRFWPKEYL